MHVVSRVAEDLAGRPGKQEDGTSQTREAKWGAIFTQTKTDEEGLPVRDHASTTYVGSFETAADFEGRVRQEALRRGLGRALKVVFLGDGAAWVWELAPVNFPIKTYRDQGFFYGSGVIDGGCKSVIGQRLKELVTVAGGHLSMSAGI